MNLTCFRCRKDILKDDEYFEFIEYKGKKIIKVDHAHKTCWNNFMSSVADTTQAKGIINNLSKYLIKVGVLPEEKVIVKC